MDNDTSTKNAPAAAPAMAEKPDANALRSFPFYEEGKVPQYQKYHAKVSYLDELELIWGKRWGAQGIGRLREVAMVRPTETEVKKLYEEDSAFFMRRSQRSGLSRGQSGSHLLLDRMSAINRACQRPLSGWRRPSPEGTGASIPEP